MARILTHRTATVDQTPTGLLPGELAVEMASAAPRLWVGVPTTIDASGRRLVADGAGPFLPLTGGALANPGHLTAAGELRVRLGVYAADYSWNDYTTGALWNWYSDTGMARLYYGPNDDDVLTVDSIGNVRLFGGLSFGNTIVPDPLDLSRHITLFFPGYGFSITGGTLNYVAGGGAANHAFYGAVTVGSVQALNDPLNVTTAPGFFARAIFDSRGAARFGIGSEPSGWFVIRDEERLAAPRLWIHQNGNLEIGADAIKPDGGPWTASSDARLKTIDDGYTHGLNEVLQLNPVIYRFTKNAGDIARKDVARQYIGLVAQDVEDIMPEMVGRRSGVIDDAPVDDLRTLNAGPLTFALVNAVKELAAQNRALEARLAAFEARTQEQK